MRVMAHRNKQPKKETKLSQEDISELAKFFKLLMDMDEKNIREGKYPRPKELMRPKTSPSQ